MICALFLAGTCLGGTIHVPGDHLTIQEAIDAAVNGDTVLVAPGTYVENIVFLGKGIHVLSSGGAAVTIIDGAGTTVISFVNDEGPDSVLEGFTITNGLCGTDSGSGILCDEAAPRILKNTITGNSSSYNSGAIYSYGGQYPDCLEIKYNLIIGNMGNGIYSRDAIIENNTIKKNEWSGVYCVYAEARIANNVITENGTGIQVRSYSTLTQIVNNLIYANHCTGYGGGGVHVEDSGPLIAKNAIFNNTAASKGGGIYCFHYSSPRILNNAIWRNQAAEGGGLYLGNESVPRTRGNTIFDNSADTLGGGVRLMGGSYQGWICYMSDNILWGNSAPVGPEMSLEYSKLDIRYCDVDGGQASIDVGFYASMEWGDGMIDADPLFVDPWKGNFCLSQDPCQPGIVNPCVDAGSAYALNHCMDDVWTRSDGVVDAGTVDLGFHYGPYTAPVLDAEPFRLPAGTGGTVEFTLMPYADLQGRKYGILGGASGTKPGFPLPGGLVLPINWDWVTYFIYQNLNTPMFENFYGKLGYMGFAEAAFNVPPVPGAYISVYFAYFLLDPFDRVSNPLFIEIVP
jgi:hypothetical protein